MLGSWISRSLAAAALALVVATPAGAVNILLSNDDGYNAPGIVALKAALEKAGHTVTIFAPSGNRSGSSTALTFGPFAVEKIESDVYSIDSTPANTVKFGAWKLRGPNRPDLILSGINSGANIGPSTVISGTVGNVIAGIEEIDQPTPGIAVSTDLVDDDVTSKANAEHFKDVAQFTADLVGKFVKDGKVVGLEPGIALNVNYPARSPDKVKGIKWAAQGLTPNFTNDYVRLDSGTYQLASEVVDVKEDVKDSDTILFQRGFITIVPINGSYTAGQTAQKDLEPFVDGLRP